MRISIIASLGGFLFGYDTGVINGTQFLLSKFFELTPTMKGWVVGSALIGCMIGAAGAGPLSIQIGRKRSLIISAILFTISAWGSGLPSILPQTVPVLVVFRLIGGIGIGVASMNAPMYIAELAPANIRGRLTTWYQMAIVLGFFVVFLVTYFISANNTEAYNEAQGWREMFWTELVPCGLFLGLLFFVPKSPRWLVMKGHTEEARAILERVHGPELANKEMNEIQTSVDSAQKNRASVLAAPFLIIVVVGTIFSMLQQFTGINAVLYYGADIFEKALGYGQEDVLKQQILLAGVNVVCTIVAMYTVDLWGRRPLVFAGSIGMLVGFLMLAYTLQTGQVGMISLIGVLMFVGSFALSMGPVVWVVLAEIFPNSVRSAAMAIAVTAQWGANYFVTQTFPMVMEGGVNNSEPWNGSLPYYLFIGFIVIIILFTFKFLPETKGKSLEEIEEHWVKG